MVELRNFEKVAALAFYLAGEYHIISILRECLEYLKLDKKTKDKMELVMDLIYSRYFDSDVHENIMLMHKLLAPEFKHIKNEIMEIIMNANRAIDKGEKELYDEVKKEIKK